MASQLVGDEHQRLAGLGILETDATQMFGVVPAGDIAVERNGLIADDAAGAVRRCRIDPMGVHVRLGTGDEEGTGQVQGMKST